MTHKRDVILTLSVVATIAAVVKFLMDGVTIQLMGHSIDFGHMDSMSYATLLAPILGAHSWQSTRASKQQKVDNPDGN